MKVAYILLTAFILLFCGTPVMAKTPYTVGIQCYTRECRMPELEKILTEAYARLGKQVEFSYRTPEQVIHETLEGKLDGCGIMTAMAVKEHPGLILVEAPISKATLVAFSIDPDMNVTSWQDLKKGSTAGILTGTILLQDTPLDHLPLSLHRFDSPVQAFTRLQEGSIDYVLGDLTAGTFLARKMGISLHTSQALDTANLYHAVSKTHKSLVPALEASLLEMLMDGTLMKLLGKYKEMLPSLPPVR